MQKTVSFIRWCFERDFYTDNLKCRFEFSVIDSSLIGTPRERGSTHTIEVVITDLLINNWNLAGAEWSDVTEDMVKVAFQCAEDHLREQLRKGPLPQRELEPLQLSTNNSAKSCPYNRFNIQYPDKTTFKVDIDDRVSQSLDECLADYVSYIQSEIRMTFWQRVKRRYKWVSHPEQRAKDILHTFLNARFGDSIYTFEEIRAGAGVIDVFVLSPRGEKAVIELKICGHGYTLSWAQSGLVQLVHYMKNKDTETGYLVVLDSRVRDFSQGFERSETANGISITTLIADLRPYVKQKDAPRDV